MQIDVGGAAPGTGYDRLVVSNAAQLAGALMVKLTNGFTLSGSNSLQIISSANCSGTFSALNLPAGIAVNYSSNGVFLVAAQAAPSPVTILSPQVTGTTFVFGFQTSSNQSYTIQHNLDLGTTNWQAVTNFIGNGSTFEFHFDVNNGSENYLRVREP